MQLSRLLIGQLDIVQKAFKLSEERLVELSVKCKVTGGPAGFGSLRKSGEMGQAMYLNLLEYDKLKLEAQMQTLPSLTANNRNSVYGVKSFEGREGCEEYIASRSMLLEQRAQCIHDIYTSCMMTSPGEGIETPTKSKEKSKKEGKKKWSIRKGMKKLSKKRSSKKGSKVVTEVVIEKEEV